MKKTTFFLLMFLSIIGNAQTTRCITDEVTNDLISTDYDAKLRIDGLNDYLANNILARQSTVPSITIPVQINILHNNQALGVGANITDSQVLDQLAALNNYYSSYGISFCLATKTGANPIAAANGGIQNTPGIIHYNTTLTTHTSDVNGQLSLVNLIHSSINRSQYLRIWVVNSINGTSSGILGYSMFPNASPIFDGVVMRYDAFGNGNPNLLTNYNLGKALVHEVGHYLGLYHTFEGGCSGMTSSNCITAGDRICDTPPVAAPNFSCAIGTNSCIEPTGDLPDAVNNYMDYGDNNCATSFTLGQKWRMYDAVNYARAELISNENLIFTGVTCINPNTITAKFSASSYYSCLTGNSITFTPLLNSSSLTYSWNFGDTASGTNNTSSLVVPSHTFSAASTTPYTVTLNVSNGAVSATFSVKIFIRSCSAITGAESTWYFSGSNAISFSTGVPVPVTKTFPSANYTFGESCAQQNTSSGSVLFYTDGYSVWRNSSNTAISSPSLMGHVSSKAGVLILPNPANSSQYYVFTIDAFYGSTISSGLNGLRFNMVTVTGGIPSMTVTNTPVTIPAGFLTGNNGAVLGGEGLTAMERCGGGYWIFTTLKSNSGKFVVVYSLTTMGLSVINSSFQLPTSVNPNKDWASSIKLSPNGNKLLYVNYYQKSYLCDFNKYTGVISNPVELPKCYGASFSPDSNLLYMDSGPNSTEIPDTVYIYQYNMNSNNIVNSRKTVGTYYGNAQDMQIGPDNKIYQALRNVNRLGIIHNPNILASLDATNECNYTPDGVVTNNVTTNSLPNFINAKTATAFPTTASISSYPSSCLTYKFVANACGTVFNWDIKNSGSVVIGTGTGTQITYTFPSTGSYTIFLKSSSNAPLANIPLVIANPVSVIVGSTSICPVGTGGSRSTNNSVTLGVGQTVVWSITSGTGSIVLNNQSSVDVNWTTPGTLTATITNASGCVITVSKTITEMALPTPTITGSSSACPVTAFNNYSTNNSVVLQSGQTALWTVTGGIGTIAGPNNSSSVNINWSELPGTITLTVTNSLGCSVTITKTIDQACVQCDCMNTLSITNTPVSGNTVNFQILNSNSSCELNNPYFQYSWNFGDGTTMNTSNSTISHTYATSGNYFVKMSPIVLLSLAPPQKLCIGPSRTNVAFPHNRVAADPEYKLKKEIIIYPNPASTFLNVQVDTEKNEKVKVRIITIDGKEITTKQWDLEKGQHTLGLDLPSNIQEGSIIVEVNIGDIKETRKILIKK